MATEVRDEWGPVACQWENLGTSLICASLRHQTFAAGGWKTIAPPCPSLATLQLILVEKYYIIDGETIWVDLFY